MTAANSSDEDVVITDDGRVAFTAEGLAFYRAYFGYAGIDIRHIKTKDDLYRASRAAFPYLFAFMAERLTQRPQTLETRALLAVIQDDTETYERTLRQIKTRDRLFLIPGSRDGHPARS